MTLDDLIERLSEIRDDLGGDLEIRLAHQPNYPLVATLDAVTTLNVTDEDRRAVYLAEGHGLGYGTIALWADAVLDDHDLEEA